MFKKELLWIDNIALIDIWSYKIKIAKCSFKKWEIEIISYAEKRQEQDIIVNWEISDISLLCENIKIALKKVDPKNEIKQIIINSVTSDIFLTSSKVIYEREKFIDKLKKEEIFRIVKEKEIECLEKGLKYIKSKTPYIKDDLRILLSNINNILIDNKEVSDLFWKTWKTINLSFTNIFIPNSKFEVVETIEKLLNKEIISIIPEEYSITKLFNQDKDIVVISIWNLSTYISIKKWYEVLWTTKINIWMNDLFKKIKEKKLIPTEKIIKDLDNDFFEEKEFFLAALKDCIIVGLQELVWWKICPSNFFITWWGWKSNFIKDFIINIDFPWNGIKMIKKTYFTSPDFNLSKKDKEKIWIDNFGLLSMIFVAYKMFYDEQTVIKDILKEVVNEIE